MARVLHCSVPRQLLELAEGGSHETHEVHSPVRHATAGVALALGSLLLTAPAVTAQDVPTAPPGNDATLRDTPAVNAAMPQALPGSQGATDGDLGEHQMTGVVRSVDPGTGTLLVDVGGKDVTVLFPVTGAVARRAR